MIPRVDESALVCPGCGSRFQSPERFCPDCRLPVVLDERGRRYRARVSERHARARKIKPQLAEGEPVRVAWAHNQAEGEFIQGMLLEEGVPSMLRRSAGFDVPDFLAAGPRDVMVPLSGASAAREILMQAEMIGSDASGGSVPPGRLLVGLLAALALGALIIWLVGMALR
jgi:hypothetical protein